MENEIKFVKRSKHRKNIMKVLRGKTMMPFEIAREAEVFHNHISYFLGQLKEHGLVECINPEVSKGKLYRLTDLGSQVADKL